MQSVNECVDHWAVMAGAKLCPDWDIIFKQGWFEFLQDFYFEIINILWNRSLVSHVVRSLEIKAIKANVHLFHFESS